ncbi:MAG TPA: FkbM family methyltransferase [Thermoanaerobaculia bacterium]
MSLRRRVLGRLNTVPMIDRHVYVARHGPARGLKRQGGMGWLPSFLPRMHEWEAEEAFLAALEWRGLTVYDVGGDQGLFTLFFADRVGEAGHVIVIEPNPRSCLRIEQNVRLNDFRNVSIVPVGLADRSTRLQFAFPSSEPARGSAVPAVADRIKFEGKATLCEIEVNALDDEIKRSALPPPHFIKMDVEGMEYPALQGMRMTLREHRPRLSIEIHGLGVEQKIANVRQVVAFMEEMDYRLWHIESAQTIESSNAVSAMEGHLYCEPR